MNTNRVRLKAAKTEFMWFVPARRRHQLPSDHLAVGSVQVKPATSVRDPGVYLDRQTTDGRTDDIATAAGLYITFWVVV